MSDIDKCISVLIKLSKSFGIDAKALPPCFNHITVTFNKKIYDGTLQDRKSTRLNSSQSASRMPSSA